MHDILKEKHGIWFTDIEWHLIPLSCRNSKTYSRYELRLFVKAQISLTHFMENCKANAIIFAKMICVLKNEEC